MTLGDPGLEEEWVVQDLTIRVQVTNHHILPPKKKKTQLAYSATLLYASTQVFGRLGVGTLKPQSFGHMVDSQNPALPHEPQEP